ncbi:MAG: branched-chain amino acid ABC transporter permease [Thermoleophilia bacterium]|nr:branched-chain amino acid ABC transporter permease [Thermoleophilia bacterium]
MTFDQFLQYIFSGITSGSVYALTAMGFTLVFNATQIINFSQGQLVMLGGMIAVALHGVGLSLWACFLGAVVIVVVVCVIFERIAIRPLLQKGVLAQIIATVGASFVFETAAMLIWGRNAVGLPAFSGEKPLPVGGAAVAPQTLWVVGAAIVIVAGLYVFYRKSLFGKAVRACAVDPTAARLQGISYSKVVVFSFALTGAISAAAGVLITPISFMSFHSGSLLGLKGFAAATLGGLGNPVGAVVGGFVLGIVEALGVGVVSAGYKDAIAFVILLLVLFIRPAGLMGAKVVSRQ